MIKISFGIRARGAYTCMYVYNHQAVVGWLGGGLGLFRVGFGWVGLGLGLVWGGFRVGLGLIQVWFRVGTGFV